MKSNNLIKEYLISGEKAFANWLVIIYSFIWVMVIIFLSHLYETKVIVLKEMTEEVKEMKSEFVDLRSKLMQEKMESNIIKKMEPLNIKPSENPPVKIDVIVEKEKKWYQVW